MPPIFREAYSANTVNFIKRDSYLADLQITPVGIHLGHRAGKLEIQLLINAVVNDCHQLPFAQFGKLFI